MTKKNQFWKGVLLGAVAGGALSLLDKETRKEMREKVQTVSGKVSYIVRNPKEVAGTLKSTYEQVSEEISYIMEKVDEIRELTPQVSDIVKETKETFSKSDESTLLEEVSETKE